MSDVGEPIPLVTTRDPSYRSPITVTLTGKRGCGKTQLLAKLVTLLRAEGFAVLEFDQNFGKDVEIAPDDPGYEHKFIVK